MRDIIYFDFETYSECSLKDRGVWNYSEHSSTEILCLAYAINNEAPCLITPKNFDDVNSIFQPLISQGYIFEAHNAFFEQCIWNNIGVKRFNWPVIPDNQWACSLAAVSALAIPKSLDKASRILECSYTKDMEGAKIMKKLCVPRDLTKSNNQLRYLIDDHPEMYQQLYDYCIQDVVTERGIMSKIRPLIGIEQKIWLLNQEINKRGVPVDMEAVEKAYHTGLIFAQKSIDRVKGLTDGQVDSYRQIAACVKWANEQGYPMENFSKSYLESKVGDKDIPENVKELIGIRLESAKTSVAKYEAMINYVNEDNRIRDCYVYHGASTGRWTGKSVQFQNLPRGKIKSSPEMEKAINIIKFEECSSIEKYFPGMGIMEFLSSSIRGVITATEGKKLICADYAAIEARGVAWLSDQVNLIEGFRKGDKIYEQAAALAYNKPLEYILSLGDKSVERLVGKTLILACGYGMGAIKFQATCASYGIILDLDFCENAIASYRMSNDMIVAQWRKQERAAILAFKTGQPVIEGKVKWFMHDKFLYCKLPSGRCLAYFRPSIKISDTKFGPKPQLYIFGNKSIKSTQVWCEFSIYGGLIVENIVQAIARDLVAYGMLELKKHNYDIIMHSHDEVICEVPVNFGNVKEYEKIMCTLPSWASDFPIDAKGWEGKHYRKD